MKAKIKILIIVLTISVILSILSYVSYIFRPTYTDAAYSQIETFHSYPKNSFEVIGYGSSHMFTGLNTNELYEKYGISAYNYSYYWQKINTTKLFLEDSLISQKPKVALIDTYYVNYVIENEGISAEVYYSKYIKNKKALKNYLKECFGHSYDNYIYLYFDIFALHDNWNSLTAESFKKLEIDESYKKERGFLPSENSMKVDYPNNYEKEQEELSEIAIKVLDDIVDLCNKNDINVVFCTIPYAEDYHYRDAMKKYVSDKECIYIDLFEDNEKLGLNANTDFSDKGHLNRKGATKVADYLGEYLINHYDLTDMRNINDINSQK